VEWKQHRPPKAFLLEAVFGEWLAVDGHDHAVGLLLERDSFGGQGGGHRGIGTGCGPRGEDDGRCECKGDSHD
jgi:hypothetical protein